MCKHCNITLYSRKSERVSVTKQLISVSNSCHSATMSFCWSIAASCHGKSIGDADVTIITRRDWPAKDEGFTQDRQGRTSHSRSFSSFSPKGGSYRGEVRLAQSPTFRIARMAWTEIRQPAVTRLTVSALLRILSQPEQWRPRDLNRWMGRSGVANL
jgi:hypothetical protein